MPGTITVPGIGAAPGIAVGWPGIGIPAGGTAICLPGIVAGAESVEAPGANAVAVAGAVEV